MRQYTEETMDNLFCLVDRNLALGEHARYFANACEFTPLASWAREFGIAEHGSPLAIDLNYHVACDVADTLRSDGWQDIVVYNINDGWAVSEVFYPNTQEFRYEI
jgi:hypothetical protein